MWTSPAVLGGRASHKTARFLLNNDEIIGNKIIAEPGKLQTHGRFARSRLARDQNADAVDLDEAAVDGRPLVHLLSTEPKPTNRWAH